MPLHGGTKDFLGKQGPLNYVAGIGRGASGFVTRSDIGPAQVDPTALQGPEDDDEYGGATIEENEAGLLSNLAPYDQDDLEADQIYASVNEKMDERRKARREAREQEELKKYRKRRPKIQQQFEDLKRSMKEITEEEWANIPDVGDIRAAKRLRKSHDKGRYTSIPDSLLAKQATEYVGQIDPQDEIGGLSTPINGLATPMTDFRQIGEAREKQLGHKLDQVSGTMTSLKSVDPTGYLTGLSSMAIRSASEISDIKRATVLLKSLVTTHPDNPSGWVSLVRVEEEAGKIGKAREHITEACTECPKSEDVWLEAARLNSHEAKQILAKAVQHVPQSIKIWLKAASLETNVWLKKKVLRKALEHVPNSVKLWKLAIEMEEEEENAHVLLAHAVECVPTSVEMWLALAKLESCENARKVLNKARAMCPTSHEIWIGAAKLEEANNNEKMVDVLVQRGVSILASKGASLSREQWMKEAEAAEASKSIHTCQAIIRATIGNSVEDEDRKITWLEDAEAVAARGFVHTSRAIYAHALEVFPNKKSIWKAAAFFERQYGSRETLQALLERAVSAVPHAKVLWLMLAKEKWLSGDVPGARAVLSAAFKANANSEQIWLAAVKLENENNELERARALLQKAQEQANTPRVWMKSAALERQVGDYAAALNLLRSGIEAFPDFDKLYMMAGQIYETYYFDIPKARAFYAQGFKKCPSSVPLWRLAASLEERQHQVIKARAIIENARRTNPQTPELWLDSVRIESRQGNKAMAKALLAKGLQECPHSGILWSEAIFLEPRPTQKSKGTDALKRCSNDPHVVLALARIFWSDRQLEKARRWFERVLQLDPDLGDAWAYMYTFERQHGSQESAQAILDRCAAAEPHHGEKWTTVSKKVENHGLSFKDILLAVASSLTD